MKSELQQQLLDKYPEQYKNLTYISCGDGWYDIISRCCFDIDQHIKHSKNRGKNIDFWWSDQKSKFGGLRLYYYSGDEYISGMVHMAESMSYGICCVCGNKGQICTKAGWLETFCDRCRLENQYETYKGSIDQ